MDFLNDGIWLIFLFSGIINMLWLLCAVCLRNTQWRYIFLHAGACHGKNFKSFWLENIMNIIGRANIFVFDIAFFIYILCLWTPKNMNTKPKNIINHFRSFFCSHIFFRFRIVLSILCAPSFFHRLPRKRFLFYFIFCGLCEYKCMHVRTGRFPYKYIYTFFFKFWMRARDEKIDGENNFVRHVSFQFSSWESRCMSPKYKNVLSLMTPSSNYCLPSLSCSIASFLSHIFFLSQKFFLRQPFGAVALNIIIVSFCTTITFKF